MPTTPNLFMGCLPILVRLDCHIQPVFASRPNALLPSQPTLQVAATLPTATASARLPTCSSLPPTWQSCSPSGAPPATATCGRCAPQWTCTWRAWAAPTVPAASGGCATRTPAQVRGPGCQEVEGLSGRDFWMPGRTEPRPDVCLPARATHSLFPPPSPPARVAREGGGRTGCNGGAQPEGRR